MKVLGSLLVLLGTGCSQIKEASDLIINPTAKERYKRDSGISSELYALWEDQVKIALNDSIQAELPYNETGKFSPKAFPIYSYEIDLKPGELFNLTIETDSAQSLVFMDLYQSQTDSVTTFNKLKSNDFNTKELNFEVEETGIYKIVIQPEIEANTRFLLRMEKNPVYLFPVTVIGNEAIQSFWGAARDAGARRHEGIDIFAKRGTPVVASTNGRITFTGEKGLGGKQVWLRDTKRNQSLYYAHLDSIHPISGRVKVGDTLGYVGNTGNAKTTPPHLHFGIYKGYRGAINPLNYIFQIEPLAIEDQELDLSLNQLITTGSVANLRSRPETTSPILGKTKANDTLQFLGKVKKWYHIRTSANKASYVHESLVSPI